MFFSCYDSREISHWSTECPRCGIISHSAYLDMSSSVATPSTKGSTLSTSVDDSNGHSDFGLIQICSPTDPSGM